jgi:hypothetical protein
MAYYYYYWHQLQKLICFLMFVSMIALVQTSLTQGRKLCGTKERLGTLALMLPKGFVPPSGPSPDIDIHV